MIEGLDVKYDDNLLFKKDEEFQDNLIKMVLKCIFTQVKILSRDTVSKHFSRSIYDCSQIANN